MTKPMPITREFNAKRINVVLNDPEVRPFVADMGEGVLDISKIVENQANILLMGEHGGCFFFRIMAGIYEVHTAISPAGRGAWAKDFLQSVAHYMFTRTDAIDVMTRVPCGHKGAEQASEYIGMKYEFSRPDGWFGGKKTPMKIYSIRLQDWAPQAPFLEQEGRWLHDQMLTAAKKAGIKEQPHGNDLNHDRYVGASVEMMRGGQYQKAVAFYNRWAFVSRHAMIQLMNVSPPTIKFDVGLLVFNGDTVEIVPCI